MEEPVKGPGRPRRKRYARQISVRFTPEQMEGLEQMADSERRDIADVVRLAVEERIARLREETERNRKQ